MIENNKYKLKEYSYKLVLKSFRFISIIENITSMIWNVFSVKLLSADIVSDYYVSNYITETKVNAQTGVVTQTIVQITEIRNLRNCSFIEI